MQPCGDAGTRCWWALTRGPKCCRRAVPEGPAAGRRVAAAYGRFCRGVFDVVAPLVPAVKPQAAFFEQLGPAGMSALAEVIRYAREKGLLVVLDGKRNDIGSTAAAYAEGFLGREGEPLGRRRPDRQPLPGRRQPPAVRRRGRRALGGVFVLVKTSNPGGADVQDLVADGAALSARGRYVERLAVHGRQRAVTGGRGGGGGTYPEQLAELRADAARLVSRARLWQPRRHGARRGRGLRPRGRGDHQQFPRHHLRPRRAPYAERFGAGRWQEAVEAATRDMIDQLRAETPAGGWEAARSLSRPLSQLPTPRHISTEYPAKWLHRLRACAFRSCRFRRVSPGNQREVRRRSGG